MVNGIALAIFSKSKCGRVGTTRGTEISKYNTKTVSVKLNQWLRKFEAEHRGYFQN